MLIQSKINIMSRNHKHHCSVIMCDIIESRNVVNAKLLNKDFNEVVREINKKWQKQLLSPLTITLGDEFQGIVENMQKAFQVGHLIKIKLLLRGIKTRLVIGEVQLDTPVNSDTAWNMMGKGLPEAREMIENKADENQYRFSVLKNKPYQQLLNAVGRSLTHIETDWTKKQCEVIGALIENPELTIRDLADEYKVGVTTIYAIVGAGDYNLYREQLRTIEAALSEV